MFRGLFNNFFVDRLSTRSRHTTIHCCVIATKAAKGGAVKGARSALASPLTASLLWPILAYAVMDRAAGAAAVKQRRCRSCAVTAAQMLLRRAEAVKLLRRSGFHLPCGPAPLA